MLAPPLLLGLSGLLTFPHYFIAAYPAAFLAIGVFVEAVAARSRRKGAVVLTVVAVLALVNMATVVQVLLGSDRSTFPNDYGLPLAYDTAAANAIAHDAAGKPYTISVDPAFRDGQRVIAQLVAWKVDSPSSSSVKSTPVQYVVLPAGVAPPAGARILLPLEPATGHPVAGVWVQGGPSGGVAQP